MHIGEHLLEILETFEENLSSEELANNEEASLSMECLRGFLTDHIDGWLNTSESNLVDVAMSRLSEIWDLISEEEKCRNPTIEKTYERATSRIGALGAHMEPETYSENFSDDYCDE